MFGISLNLVLLGAIAVACLLYPIAGAAQLYVDIEKKKRPVGSGFSFLPELLVFPALFFGAAKLLDLIVAPWGSWIVIVTCAAMTGAATIVIGRACFVKSARTDAES